jgi:putative ABC transport system permease protein
MTSTWFDAFAQDLRYGLRTLRKTPGFTTIAVLSLALGVGANTGVFSVVHGVLLRPLPYPEPDRLVAVGQNVSMPEFDFWKEHARSFVSAAGFRSVSDRRLSFEGREELISAAIVTADFFRTFGVPLALGREFEAVETKPTGPQAIVLGDALWRRSFHSDPSVVGRPVTIDGATFTVVGVASAGFWFRQPSDAFVPLRPTGNLGDRGTNTWMVARLRPGISLTQANAEMPAVMESFRRERPDPDYSKDRKIALSSYQTSLNETDVRTNLFILLGAVGLLLLIACSNLGSLLLARLAARRREIAVRLAVGCGRARLLRQFLVEGLLLALAGSAAGVVGAYWSLDALLALVPFTLVSSAPIQLELPVLAFATLIAAAATVAFSIPAFLSASRMDLQETLKSAGRGNSARQRGRSVLVVAEVALSVTLLVSAALLIQSLYRLYSERLGFTPDGLLTFWTTAPRGGYRGAADRQRVESEIAGRLRAVPGIRSVSAINVVPLTGQSNFPVQQDGAPEHSIGGMEVRVVTPEYFDTMGIRVVRGRAFTARDTAAAPAVALVNETVARAWWPQGEPLGGRVLLGALNGRSYVNIEQPSREVIGVAADTKTVNLKQRPRPTVYVVSAQAGWHTGGMNWMVRGDLTAQQAKATIEQVDTRLRIERFRSMDSILARGTADARFDAWLFGSFAALALALTAIGVYGLLAFSVARRTNEIGARMALGATRFQVLRLVLRQGLGLVATGLALGLAGSFALTRSLATLLFGVKPTDPLSFALVAVVLMAVGLLASYIPARRATRVDPVIALRAE